MLKMQTSMFLILGSLVSFLGWFFIYPGGDGPDATAAENAANLMANPGAAKVGMLMGFGGMGAMFMGFLNISRNMASGNGPGSSFGNVSGVFALALIIVGVFMIGIEWGAAEASSAETATSLMEISKVSETSFFLACGFLLLLIGIGIILEKNYHVIIGGFSAIAGVSFLAANAGGDLGMLGFIGWIGMLLVGIALGVQTLRSQS